MNTTAYFLETLGVNTHLDFIGSPYANQDTTITALRHLGINRLRDSARHATTLGLWVTVRNAINARFHPYLPKGSIADVEAAFALLPVFHRNGLIRTLEGPNEEDTEGTANSIEAAKAVQARLVPMAHEWDRKLINISFGGGWTQANSWQGNYDKAGDMSAVCTYANAHTYPSYDARPQYRQRTNSTMARLNRLAQLAAPGRPVATTEIGWDRQKWPEADVAKAVLQAAFSGFALGCPYTFFYSLFDNPAINTKFGLMNSDGTARPSGDALHNLTALLRGGSDDKPPATLWIHGPFAAGDRVVTLRGNGCTWAAIWNEVDAPRPVVVINQIYELFQPLVSATSLGQVQPVISDEVQLLRIPG